MLGRPIRGGIKVRLPVFLKTAGRDLLHTPVAQQNVPSAHRIACRMHF